MATLALCPVAPIAESTADVVDCLRNMLESAVENKSIACAVVLIHENGGTSTIYCDNAPGHYFTLLGGVADLQHRLHTEKRETS